MSWNRVNLPYIPVYVLLLTLFYSSLALQYVAFFLFFAFYLTDNKRFKNNSFFWFPFLFFFIAIISWLYNLYYNNTDYYAIIFWFIAYMPNFILVWLIITYSDRINFIKVYNFYKTIVYIQVFLLIYSVIKYEK